MISRSSGRGIVAAAAYRSGERILEEKSQAFYDFTTRTGILHTEIMAPLCAPEWVYDRHTLWNTVDAIEKRKDAQLARELMVALPKELKPGQYIQLVRGFVVQNFVKEGMIADFAIHAPSKKKGGQNYHAHILLTLRSINNEGFGNKARHWNLKSYICHWREAWANETNQILEREGFECRIDHRSRATKEQELAAQLDMKPQDITIEHNLASFEQGDGLVEADELRDEIPQICETQISVDECYCTSVDESDRQQALEISKEIGYSEYLDPRFSLKQMQEHQSALQFLLGLKKHADLSLDKRTDALDQFARRFQTHLSKISYLAQRLSDGEIKDWLILLQRMESACFKSYSNQILADVLEEKIANPYAPEIATRRYLATVGHQDYLHCISEWHYRSVTDDRYLPLNPNAADKIKQLRSREQQKWIELYSKAEKLHWKPAKLNQEIQNLQRAIDRARETYFGLEKAPVRDRSLSR